MWNDLVSLLGYMRCHLAFLLLSPVQGLEAPPAVAVKHSPADLTPLMNIKSPNHVITVQKRFLKFIKVHQRTRLTEY
jgi:hypothetical protein